MAKLLHIFYHKEGTFSLLCQQVQLITVSKNKGITFTTRPLGTQTSSLHSFNGYFDALTVSKHTPRSLERLFFITFTYNRKIII